MRLEWIEDILAVLETGSLVRAAERRFLTQSAFTRRVRLIEESLGATLFDRSRKPVSLLPEVARLEPALRQAAAGLRRLRDDIRASARPAGRSLSFACQHAITATISPAIVQALTEETDLSVKVRSGNRDECLVQLLAGEVDFVVMYEVAGDRSAMMLTAFEMVSLGHDLLAPLCKPEMRGAVTGPVLPVIRYPADVFLGGLFDRAIAPKLPEGMSISAKAETELTLAMMQFVLSGIGIAWLPLSLATKHLVSGQLVRMDEVLPAQQMEVKLIRLADNAPDREDRIWQKLIALPDLLPVLEPVPHSEPGSVQPVQ